MEGGGVEPDKCSRSKCASLDSIAASRAFSLLLRELEGGAGGEGDVVIGGEEGDQCDHNAGLLVIDSRHFEQGLEIKPAATATVSRRCLCVWRSF